MMKGEHAGGTACFFMRGEWREFETNFGQILVKSGVMARLVKYLRSWIKSDGGSTAIEFGMLAMPFIMLVVGIMEVSLMFAGMSVLDGATADAARKVRTGQVQQASGKPEDIFKNSLCNSAKVMLSCGKLQYEVIEIDKFANFSNYKPSYDKDGKLKSRGFTPGGVNTVNLIRVTYLFKLATPLLGNILADSPGMTKRFVSTVVLETEPYDLNEVAGSL